MTDSHHARRFRTVYEQSTQTRVYVSLHTDEPNGLDMPEPAMSNPVFGRVIACNTNKAFGGASGKWSLTFKKIDQIELAPQHGNPYRDPQHYGNEGSLLTLWDDPEQVWVRIFFVVDGQIIHTTTGQIDNIAEATQRAGLGARSESYTITGRDHGKMFEVSKPTVNLFASQDDPSQQLSVVMKTYLRNIIGTPEDFVRMLCEVWLGSQKSFIMPQSLGGSFFFSKLSMRLQQMTAEANGELPNPNLIAIDNMQGQPLWAMLQSLCHGLLNEMWVDLVQPITPEGRYDTDFNALEMGLFLRERPFPHRIPGRFRHQSVNELQLNGLSVTRTQIASRKWEQLRTHEISLSDTGKYNMTKGGAEHRFNYWVLDVAGLGGEDFGIASALQFDHPGINPGEPGNIPVFSSESIRRHGMRPWKQSSRFIPAITATARKNKEASITRMAALWLQKLHDWYVVAPLELSGSLTTTRARPEIRIGERVRVERPEGHYELYVEGVQNAWQYPGAGSTTLTLTRGELEGRSLLDVVYDAYYPPHDPPARNKRTTTIGGGAIEGVGVTGDDVSEDGMFFDLEGDNTDDEQGMFFDLNEEEEGMFFDLNDDAAVTEGVTTADDSVPDLTQGTTDTTSNPLDQQRLEQGRPIDTDPLAGIPTGNDPLAGA